METHVRAEPPATIEWFKDSVNIARNDPKYQVFDHPDGLCELIVNFPNSTDCGKYVCKATNRCGTTELGHYVLFEGKEHHIAENIHGVYHADHNRLDRAKAEAHGSAPVENGVADAEAADEGSKKGSKQGSKQGSLRGSRAGSNAPPTPAPTPAPAAAAPPPPPAKKEPRDARITINFPTKLSNRVVAAGSKLKLTCYLEGADPSIRWFKDDQPVVYNPPKLRQNQQNGVCSLEFQSVTVADSGVYKCWARNTTGEASTSATLEVYSSGDSADLAPTFTRSIKETYNSKINEINISCHVRAVPTPTITWSKDGVTIEPNEKYQLIEHDDGVCELNISDAKKQDNGKYVCLAENRAGRIETTHLVQIAIRETSRSSSLSSLKDLPPTPNNEEAKPPTGAGEADEAAKGKSVRQKKDSTSSSSGGGGGGRRYAPPPPPDPKKNLFFMAFLCDRTVAEGAKLKLSCYIQGPDPQCRWFKDEQQIQFSPRCRAEMKDGLASLLIQNALLEDTGVYRILARNEASDITSECKLNVYETLKPTATAPLFTNNIKGRIFVCFDITICQNQLCSFCVQS